jgi:hypothetical protein
MFRSIGQIIRLPGVLGEIYQLLSYSNLDLEAIRPECTLNNLKTFSAVFWGNIILVFIPFVVLMIVLFILQRLNIKAFSRDKFFYKKRRIRGLIIILMFSYFTISTRACSALNCSKVGDKVVLTMDSTILCFKGEHIAVTVVAILILLCYSFGLPTSLAFLLHKNKGNKEKRKKKKEKRRKKKEKRRKRENFSFFLLYFLNKLIN